MKKKIKLVDFLEFVNFRDYTDSDDYNTKIIRIEYPDKDTHDNYSKDRYFEYGVYNFGVDNRKRFVQTINPYILNCFVSDVRVNDDGVLTIYVTTEDDIDDDNLDCEDYELEEYDGEELNEGSKDGSNIFADKMQKINICSPLNLNCYKDAWDYLVTELNGVSEVCGTVDIEKLQELMFSLENKIEEQNKEH